ncbi:MAG: IPT/TIG domain-containing protein [Myxococcota bacterium]
MTLRLTPALLLIGCGDLGLGSDGEDLRLEPDTAAQLAPLRIDTLEPAQGPLAGGTPVLIRGAGFDTQTLVKFGNSALAITFIDDQTLSIQTPAAAVETAVDVTVENSLGRTILTGGFTYTDRAAPDDTGNPGDTDDPGDDDPVGSTGLTGGRVELWTQIYACPSCFNLLNGERVTASAILHTPFSGTWLNWLPDTGTCTGGYDDATPTANGIDVGPWAYLSSGGASIPLGREYSTGTTAYSADGLNVDDYVRTASYDLDAGDVRLEGVLQTTASFSDLQPMEILFTSPLDAWTHPISASNATFQWAPSGTDDEILIFLEIYSPLDATFMGTILCRSADLGGLTIPNTMFGPYYSNSPTNVSIYRVKEHRTIHPDDGSTIEGFALFGYVGTAVLVP